ncbi:hypothetical protein SLS62_003150 [Diatrype stigma]|uniref:2EXR domain-containing protein n=1 Tax=Diatrype stigma TaxID=117547 RepID=A0AAN9YRM6_9PEZI
MGNHQQEKNGSEASSTASNNDSSPTNTAKTTGAQWHQNQSQTFHLFPNLPPELQDLIWALALPRGRLLHVLSDSEPDTSSTTMTTEGLLLPPQPPLAIARTCRAARAAALRSNLVVARRAPNGRTTTTSSVWFDGARDILLIDECYPYHADQRHGASSSAALFAAAAETVAVSEEHLLGREPRHGGFLADLVQSSSSGTSAGRSAFPRLRRVLVVTTRVLVAPRSWPRNWGHCDDGNGGSISPYPYHVVRPFRTPESFAIDVLAPTEARILKLLRIAHARRSVLWPRASLDEDEGEGELESGVIGSASGGSDVDAREEKDGGDEASALFVDRYDDSDNSHSEDDGDGGDSDGYPREQPLTRDHPWVRKRWDRLPQFVQAISVKDCDTGEVVCKSTLWEDIV